MNLLQTLLQQNPNAIAKAQEVVGLNHQQMENVLAQLMPVLSQKTRQVAANDEKIMEQAKQQQTFLDRPAQLQQPQAVTQGNDILATLLGSKQDSRQLAEQAATNTGVDSSVIKQLLPIAATMFMGHLGQQNQSQSSNMLLKLLDRDNDGSVIDDVFGMAKDFLSKKE